MNSLFSTNAAEDPDIPNPELSFSPSEVMIGDKLAWVLGNAVSGYQYDFSVQATDSFSNPSSDTIPSKELFSVIATDSRMVVSQIITEDVLLLGGGKIHLATPATLYPVVRARSPRGKIALFANVGVMLKVDGL